MSQRYKATKLSGGNKKTALCLAASMVILIGIYFGCIKAYIAVIQQIYIWGALALGVAYMFVAGAIAAIKQSGNAEQNSKKLEKLDFLRKALLIVIIPIIFALLIDYMLLYLGFAGYFGI